MAQLIDIDTATTTIEVEPVFKSCTLIIKSLNKMVAVNLEVVAITKQKDFS